MFIWCVVPVAKQPKKTSLSSSVRQKAAVTLNNPMTASVPGMFHEIKKYLLYMFNLIVFFFSLIFWYMCVMHAIHDLYLGQIHSSICIAFLAHFKTPNVFQFQENCIFMFVCTK